MKFRSTILESLSIFQSQEPSFGGQEASFFRSRFKMFIEFKSAITKVLSIWQIPEPSFGGQGG